MSINRHYKQVLNNQSLLTRLSNFIDSSYSLNAERLCFYGIIHDNNNNVIEILNLKVISPATFISSSWHHVMRVKKGAIFGTRSSKVISSSHPKNYICPAANFYIH
jgi:hypothetical protein